MKICGVVAEYNPFHNGHAHHLEQSRKLNDADYCIAVISGSFTQRGTPAIADKYTRTRSALMCGADLVLELPVFYAVGSAQYFADGAVSMLEKLGCVDVLSFGSEIGDLKLLQQFAEILYSETPKFRAILKSKLKEGYSYPTARASAIITVYPELSQYVDILNKSNNILGIAYLKSLHAQNSNIAPHTVKRVGADYHDMRFGNHHSSSAAIREALFSGRTPADLKDQMPAPAFEIFADYLQREHSVYTDDFSLLLQYKLISEQAAGYAKYLDVSTELSDRILNHLYEFTTITEFCNLLKTKELTYVRINRALFHILLNITSQEVNHYIEDLKLTPYARVLGFRRDAAPLLTEIDKHTSIPLVTRLSDAHSLLDKPSMEMLGRELEITDIYNSIRCGKSGIPMRSEYSTPIVIL